MFRQLDVVASKLDGELGSNNEPILYDLSGDTFFAPATTEGSLLNLYTKKVPEAITSFDTLLMEKQITKKDTYFDKRSSTIGNNGDCKFVYNGIEYFQGNCAWNRFYITMSPLFTSDSLLTQLKTDLTSGPEVKAATTDIINKINNYCDDFAVECRKFQEIWTKAFDEVVKSPVYETVSKFKLPDNQVKKCNYVTPATDDINQKNKRIKDLYSNQNLNDKKGTFNGKVTFN